MEAWGWLVAYIVGFGLMQLLLYRYFQRDDPSPDATPPADQSAQRSLEKSPPQTAEEGTHCNHCGAFNECAPTISYCKQCVQPLG